MKKGLLSKVDRKAIACIFPEFRSKCDTIQNLFSVRINMTLRRQRNYNDHTQTSSMIDITLKYEDKVLDNRIKSSDL